MTAWRAAAFERYAALYAPGAGGFLLKDVPGQLKNVPGQPSDEILDSGPDLGTGHSDRAVRTRASRPRAAGPVLCVAEPFGKP
jgi:hypothetical protein